MATKKHAIYCIIKSRLKAYEYESKEADVSICIKTYERLKGLGLLSELPFVIKWTDEKKCCQIKTKHGELLRDSRTGWAPGITDVMKYQVNSWLYALNRLCAILQYNDEKSAIEGKRA